MIFRLTMPAEKIKPSQPLQRVTKKRHRGLPPGYEPLSRVVDFANLADAGLVARVRETMMQIQSAGAALAAARRPQVPPRFFDEPWDETQMALADAEDQATMNLHSTLRGFWQVARELFPPIGFRDNTDVVAIPVPGRPPEHAVVFNSAERLLEAATTVSAGLRRLV
jgi:hypothetical protein